MAKVLLADDDPKVLPVLALHLRNEDYEVVCANSAEDAVRAAITAKPDIMVLDMGMVDGGGANVYRRIVESQALSAIPVIYLVEEDMPRGGRAPKPAPGSTIHKPVPSGELLEKVDQALRSSANRTRTPRSSGSRRAEAA